MATVALSRVTRRFPDGTLGVDGVDMTIDDGELVVLVGPSGSGKSTLLRMIAGLDQPTAGAVLMDGEDVTLLRPRERNVAMVFQNYALYPHMTVAQNLEFPLKMAGMPAGQRRRRIEETAVQLNLSELLHRKPAQLSGGQRQRVAMGRALVRQPRVFLMDEPLSNLDAELRGQIRSEIRALQQRLGIPTVYVTHDQAEALSLGDRIAVLRQGRVQQLGTPEQIYNQPANAFVARFIGTPGMNLFSAHWIVKPERLRVADQVLVVPERVQSRLRAATGDVIGLGVRPEALRRRVEDGDMALNVHVTGHEYQGSELLLLFRVGVDSPVYYCRDRFCFDRTTGETVLATRWEDVYWFDRQGERVEYDG